MSKFVTRDQNASHADRQVENLKANFTEIKLKFEVQRLKSKVQAGNKRRQQMQVKHNRKTGQRNTDEPMRSEGITQA